MKKNRKVVALLGLGAILALSSCISDKGTNADLSTISELSVLGDGLQARYEVERHGTLTIEAPEVSQTGETKPLSYEWEINRQVVSTERTLSYVCRDFGLFDARLKISNGDDVVYRAFKVNVRYSYLTGVYALANKGGKALLTYYPEGHEGKVLEQDVLELNNEGFNATGEATALHCTYSTRGETPYFYVAMNQGGRHRIYQLDANLMTILRNMEIPEPVIDMDGKDETSFDYVTASGAFGLATNRGFYHNLIEYNSYVNGGGGIAPLANLTVAPVAAYWKMRNSETTYQGRVMYDNGGERLIIAGTNISNDERNLFAGTFTGYQFAGITPVGNQRQIFLVLRQTSTGAYAYWRIFPGNYPDPFSNYLPTIMASGTIPSSVPGFGDGMVMSSWATRDLVYYALGNAVYGYSALSQGNFPSTPFITLDAGETIVDMKVDEQKGKLYIATNASSGDLVGSLYCYDLETNAQLWAQRNVTGNIREIILRQ